MDENLSIFLRIVRLIEHFESKNRKKYYNEIFKILLDVIDFEYGAIFLLNHETSKINLVAEYGQVVDLIQLVNFEMGKGFSAWVAKEKRTVILNNLHKSSPDSKLVVRSFMSLPMLIEKQLVGVINFGHSKSNAFSEDVEPFLQVVTSLITGLIERNNAVEKLVTRNKEISIINKELEETRDKLVEAEQKAAVSAMAVSLNHEINNPLMIISGNLQMLSYKCQDESLKKKFSVIDEQLDRISGIIRKLRDIEEINIDDYISESDEKMLKV